MDAKTEDAFDIVLKDRWNNVVAALQGDADGRIRMFRFLDIDGVPQYEVYWDAWQQVADYTLPRTVRMISGNGDQVTWTLERFWPDVEIPPATFILEDAGNP
jgi:hypothetical protein